jgi:hypothetical protein
VGCSQLIIDGKVKIKQGQGIERFEETGIRFKDGSFLEANIVVLATGMISSDLADCTVLSPLATKGTSPCEKPVAKYLAPKWLIARGQCGASTTKARYRVSGKARVIRGKPAASTLSKSFALNQLSPSDSFWYMGGVSSHQIFRVSSHLSLVIAEFAFRPCLLPISGPPNQSH